jgi:hypothetical protein
MAANSVSPHGWQQILFLLTDGSKFRFSSRMATNSLSPHGWQSVSVACHRLRRFRFVCHRERRIPAPLTAVGIPVPRSSLFTTIDRDTLRSAMMVGSMAACLRPYHLERNRKRPAHARQSSIGRSIRCGMPQPTTEEIRILDLLHSVDVPAVAWQPTHTLRSGGKSWAHGPA